MAYNSIKDAINAPPNAKHKLNLFALTGECTAPKRSRGTDWYSLLKVTDPSISAEAQSIVWQDVQVFAPVPGQLPQPRNLYDIIRLHRVSVQEFNGRPQLVSSLGKFSAFALFDGRPQGTPEPYQISSASYTVRENEDAVCSLLRNFARPLRSGPAGGPHPAQRTIQTVQPGTFFDLTCQVLSVEAPQQAGGPPPAHARQATLYVWDGTDATPFPCSKDTSRELQQDPHLFEGVRELRCEEGYQEMAGLQRLPALPPAPKDDRLREVHSYGTWLPVLLFRLPLPVMLPAVGSWIRMRNISACVVAGQLQALFLPKSKFSAADVSHHALDNVARRRAEGRVSDWADMPRLLSRCLHANQPFTPLRQVLVAKGVLTLAVEQKTAMEVRKFRCLVRVTAYQPHDVRQICQRREDCQPAGSSDAPRDGWVYAARLTLEDATGDVDAHLFDADGANFFQGLPPQDLHAGGNAAAGRLHHAMRTLMGDFTDKPGPGWDAPALLPCAGGLGPASVIVLCGSKVQALAADDGRQLWEHELPEDWASASIDLTPDRSATGGNEAGVAITGVVAGGKAVKHVHLAAVNGAVLHRVERTAPRPVAGRALSRSGTVVAVLADGSRVCTGALSGCGDLACGALPGNAAGLSGGLELLPVEADGAVAVRGAGGIAVLALKGGSVSDAHFVPGATAAAHALSRSDSAEAVALAGTAPDGAPWLQLVSVAAGAAAATAQQRVAGAAWAAADGAAVPVAVVAAGAAATDAPSAVDAGIRALMVGADATLALAVPAKTPDFDQYEAAWVREEALGAAGPPLFLDLPAPSAALLAERRAAEPSLGERLHAEWLAVKDGLGLAMGTEKAELKRFRARTSSRLLPHRDPNGFRRLIVLLSESGKLFGLHSGDGHQLWSLGFAGGAAPERVLPWRTSHDTSQAPQVLLLGNSAGGRHAFYSVVDAHAGRQVAQGAVDLPVSQVVELPTLLHEGRFEQRVYLLIGPASPAGGAPPTRLLPDTPRARAHLRGVGRTLRFWRANSTTGLVEGFAVDSSGAATPAWAVAFPPLEERILALAAPDLHSPVYSYAKVLGDRSLKLKHLNPNTLFVATGDGRTLTASLLDTVSGRFLHRQLHAGASGPVHAVMAENWLVYHYWSSANVRFQATVVELYEELPRPLTPAGLLLGSGTNATLSSFQPTPLEVLTQTYFTPFGVKALAASTTAHGITSKMLLMGMHTDQVYAMDKRLLDPRRARRAPTAEDRAEQLAPYAEELPVAPGSYATFNGQVASLRGVACAPAAMESTCIMLARGLDLFLSRVQPSRTFDLLPDDFPFGTLAVFTAAMVAAAGVLRVMDSRAAVKRKWQ
ncbi:hypothetical protein WJX81_005905 [Elliptochloris bilobata]|uniref:ER membrane protein complex subunit 1 n=1 Tax=Elliptochloris bilobata TaxID=381761 RepID=A0AAW1QUK1_9CHLO